MKKFLAFVAAVFVASAAYGQNAGTVTNHAFAIGKGPNVSGYTSLLCGAGQLAVAQAGADPICRTVSGDWTLNAAGVSTLATVNANVGAFGSAANCATITVNAKGLVTAASQTACVPGAVPLANITGLGTGVATALGVNVGSAGAVVVNGGALGTPSSATLTNGTGLPVGTGLTGAGTGILAALGVNVGSAGAPVLFNGAGGTPSSLVLTNGTGLPATSLTGALQAAQEPAHTGDVTNSAGSLALTLSAGNAGNLNSGTLLAARMPALTGDCAASAGTVATTCTKINGVDQTTAWTVYTPTATASSGTITTYTATGRYRQIGKTVHVQATVSFSNAGTGSGNLIITLPFTAAGFIYVGSAYESNLTGKSGASFVAASSPTLSTRDAAGSSFIATGAVANIGLTYEIP